MAVAIITPDQDAVVSEVDIAAPPARVFDALIDPQQVMQWWTSDVCPIDAFSMQPRKGGRWEYDSRRRNPNADSATQFHCEGEVLEYDPPRTLAYSWTANWHDDKQRRTVVRWELTPKPGGTHVKVTHSGLAQEPTARKDYSGGWVGVVEKLKKFVENKK
jgi:uncharacterized protein YndB with AHSA1/START domain